MDNYPNYEAYRQGRKIRQVFLTVFENTGIDLTNGAGIPELFRFQKQFGQYKIVVYRGLSCEDIMFEGQVDSPKGLNIHYDDVELHYHVIANLTNAMVTRYVCKGCNKAYTRDNTHVCDQTCSDCMFILPYGFTEFRIPCEYCHGHFRNPTCFAKQKRRTSNRKSVYECTWRCETYGWLVTDGNHECNKRICDNSKENKVIGHLCYMLPLKDALLPASDKVLYDFCDFKTSRNTK